MSKSASNAQTLIMRIFRAWHADNLAEIAESTAFEIFASELTLRPYGLGLEEIQSGLAGGGQDGAIDSVYVFFDEALVTEDSEIVLDSSKPSAFGQERPLELWVV